jgi:hypothetical protein
LALIYKGVVEMQLRLLVVASLVCAAYGCATDNQSGSSSSEPSARDGSYRTGSRLPSYDPPGTAASREVSADDWNDARRTGGNQGPVK